MVMMMMMRMMMMIIIIIIITNYVRVNVPVTILPNAATHSCCLGPSLLPLHTCTGFCSV